MASATNKSARRLLLLLQIALFVVSAVIMSGGSVCHGAQHEVIGHGSLRPDRPACIGERCPTRPRYGPRPGIPGPGRGGIPYPTRPQPPNGEIPRP
ncbi:unnamed protein product [Urochloa decumbens]|uniref:Uncharacterized protein n=1 Tax=Urochloa decumbens TaxID=240449 RepID=A0ABC9E078_9POAL